MTLARLLTVLLLPAVLLAGAEACRADELVQVAAQRGEIPGAESAQPLFGYIARPKGPGPFPAVVELHGCSGFSGHDITTALTLKSWGYVALALDSLGGANTCNELGGKQAELVDAYAALRYLAAQSFVAWNKVAIMGYSMGGAAVLYAVERSAFERDQPLHFRAAVAYYPQCDTSRGVMTVPTLVLVGERDDWTPAAACRQMAAGETDIGITRGTGPDPMITLVVYPGATHAF
ncbi:MAG TPA: dienelactone hydrolase family protein, partial [Acetobacteraceae bacterium]